MVFLPPCPSPLSPWSEHFFLLAFFLCFDDFKGEGGVSTVGGVSVSRDVASGGGAEPE